MMGMDEKERILKEPVLGMVVIMHRDVEGKGTISAYPIVSNDELFADHEDIDIEKDDKVLGVLPVPPGTFKVLGLFPDKGHEEDLENGTYEELGFEFRDGTNLNWIEVLNGRLKFRKGLETKKE